MIAIDAVENVQRSLGPRYYDLFNVGLLFCKMHTPSFRATPLAICINSAATERISRNCWIFRRLQIF